MKKITLTFAIALAFVFVNDAMARDIGGCNPFLVKYVGEDLRISNLNFYHPAVEDVKFKSSVFISARCEYWSYKNDKIIAVFSYFDEHSILNQDSYFSQINYFVAIISKNRVVSGYKWSSYDVCCNAPEIDTTHYDLAPRRRAFGIDITPGYYQHTTAGDRGRRRTLFLEQGEKIIPILEDVTLEDWHYQKERVVNNDLSTDHSIEENKYTIIVSAEVTNGFHDLVINVTTTLKDETGVETKRHTKLYKVFKYKDGSYK